jgi:hypothetical protein
LQIEHRLCLAAGSFRGIGIAPLRKALQPALRWDKASLSPLQIW